MSNQLLKSLEELISSSPAFVNDLEALIARHNKPPEPKKSAPIVPMGDLTPHQQEQYDQILLFLSNNHQHKCRLSGAAGTGKSFLVKTLITTLISQNQSIIVACPTNKAVKNLEEGLDNLDVKIMTIASLLGLQPILDEATGDEIFESLDNSNSTTFNNLKVVILDEYSMIPKDQYQEICTKTGELGIKLLLVGDSEQLPPVGEESSSAATDTVEVDLKLEEVVRHEGELLELAQTIRRQSRISLPFTFTQSQDNTICLLSSYAWVSSFQQAIKNPDFSQYPNLVRALAWTNQTVDKLNYVARAARWSSHSPDELCKDDLLILRRPCFRPRDKNSYHKSNLKIVATNSTEFWVSSSPTLKIDSRFHLSYWEFPVTYACAGNPYFPYKLRLLTREAEKSHAALLKEAIQNKVWKDYGYLKHFFDDLRFAYALTVHRAQGSTINNVYLEWADIRRCPDLKQILYTALTRAKNSVYVLD